VYTAGCDISRHEVFEVFRTEPTADRTVAVLGRLNEGGTVEAAVLAAQDAIGTGELVAVSDDPAWAGLWASLHAEHPATAITTVRTQLDQAGLRAASGIGAAPGQYRELTINADGLVRELVARPAAIERGGPFPLGQDDVVLISRSAGPAGLALAQVLACCGAGVAVVGREHPGRDDALIATLEQLRQAGAPIGYEIVNPASAAALDAAVRRIERRLGQVTVIAQTVRTAPPRALADLDPADVRAEVADQARLLDQLVTAAGTLKLIITFGSIAGRYGLAENAKAALATSALADQGTRLAAASPGCQALHVDWPAWSGTAPIPIAEGSRLLLNLLAAANRPARLAVHGRVSPQPLGVAARWPTPSSP
jgi:enediyne polyketide synthase